MILKKTLIALPLLAASSVSADIYTLNPTTNAPETAQADLTVSSSSRSVVVSASGADTIVISQNSELRNSPAENNSPYSATDSGWAPGIFDYFLREVSDPCCGLGNSNYDGDSNGIEDRYEPNNGGENFERVALDVLGDVQKIDVAGQITIDYQDSSSNAVDLEGNKFFGVITIASGATVSDLFVRSSGSILADGEGAGAFDAGSSALTTVDGIAVLGAVERISNDGLIQSNGDAISVFGTVGSIVNTGRIEAGDAAIRVENDASVSSISSTGSLSVDGSATNPDYSYFSAIFLENNVALDTIEIDGTVTATGQQSWEQIRLIRLDDDNTVSQISLNGDIDITGELVDTYDHLKIGDLLIESGADINANSILRFDSLSNTTPVSNTLDLLSVASGASVQTNQTAIKIREGNRVGLIDISGVLNAGTSTNEADAVYLDGSGQHTDLIRFGGEVSATGHLLRLRNTGVNVDTVEVTGSVRSGSALFDINRGYIGHLKILSPTSRDVMSTGASTDEADIFVQGSSGGNPQIGKLTNVQGRSTLDPLQIASFDQWYARDGSLPSEYEILVRDVADFGQLELVRIDDPAANFGSSTMSFDVAEDSALKAAHAYEDVLLNVATSNLAGSLAGSTGLVNWELTRDMGSISMASGAIPTHYDWDLHTEVSTQGVTDTTASVEIAEERTETATGVVNKYMMDQLLYAAARPMATAGGSTAGFIRSPRSDENTTFTIGGQRTSKSNGVNVQRSLFIAASNRVSKDWVLGGFMERLLSISNDGQFDLDPNRPSLGAYGLYDGWGKDTVGRVSVVSNDMDITINRAQSGVSESASGTASLTLKGLDMQLYHERQVNDRVRLIPNIGLNYLNTERGGYTENATATTANPLTYGKMETDISELYYGADFGYLFTPKSMAILSVGMGRVISFNSNESAVSGIEGLPNMVLDEPDRKNRFSLGLAFEHEMTDSSALKVSYEQKTGMYSRGGDDRRTQLEWSTRW